MLSRTYPRFAQDYVAIASRPIDGVAPESGDFVRRDAVPGRSERLDLIRRMEKAMPG